MVIHSIPQGQDFEEDNFCDNCPADPEECEYCDYYLNKQKKK